MELLSSKYKNVCAQNCLDSLGSSKLLLFPLSHLHILQKNWIRKSETFNQVYLYLWFVVCTLYRRSKFRRKNFNSNFSSSFIKPCFLKLMNIYLQCLHWPLSENHFCLADFHHYETEAGHYFQMCQDWLESYCHKMCPALELLHYLPNIKELVAGYLKVLDLL